MTYIGTAGWSISRPYAERFPSEGSSLQRYAAVLNCTEINSSFYRPHRPDTWQRWADSVPDHFRFSVKAPRTISHEQRLSGTAPLLDDFRKALAPLGEKLGPILFQLPPSLAFDPTGAQQFFADVRDRWDGPVVLEPRHKTWETTEAGNLTMRYRITPVIADPAKVAMKTTGVEDTVYLRLHGAPKIYYSSYSGADLDHYHAMLRHASSRQCWCIFDNTASGAALANALEMRARNA